MEDLVRNALRGQYRALAQMMRNAIGACPEELWQAEERTPSFNHMAYHIIFYLDYYSGDSPEMFEAYVYPLFAAEEDADLEKVPSKSFTKDELIDYLESAERKCLEVIEGLSADAFARPCAFYWKEGQNVLDLLLQNLRHLNHHIGQLNLVLRIETGTAPTWIGHV